MSIGPDQQQQQQQQQNPMDGILTTEQQAKLAACKTAEDLKHFMEEKAQEALTAEQKADAQKYWEEHDSPQALEAAKKATEANEKEDAALLGGVGTAIDATFIASRGGVSSLGMMAGPLGGAGLFAALLGIGPETPSQDGPTPPAQTRQNNNIFSLA